MDSIIVRMFFVSIWHSPDADERANVIVAVKFNLIGTLSFIDWERSVLGGYVVSPYLSESMAPAAEFAVLVKQTYMLPI